MQNRRRVVLYGSSLFMAGVQASLLPHGDLDVTCLEESAALSRECLEALRPDVIVFDMTGDTSDVTIPLLREYGGLVLVGVDPASDRVVVLSGRQSEALTMQDVVEAINCLPRRERRCWTQTFAGS